MNQLFQVTNLLDETACMNIKFDLLTVSGADAPERR